MRVIINLNSVLSKQTNFLCSKFLFKGSFQKKFWDWTLKYLPPPPPPMESGLLVLSVFCQGATFSQGIERNALDFRNAWLRLKIIAPPPPVIVKHFNHWSIGLYCVIASVRM